MKKYYLLLTMLVVLAFQTKTFSQWTDVVNNDINYEFKVTDNFYQGGADEDPPSEPVINTDIAFSGNWWGLECHHWTCTPPCYNQDNAWMRWFGTGPFDTEFSTYIYAYESDNESPCNSIPADDDLTVGNGLLRDGQESMKIVYPSTDFRPVQWVPYLGNGGNTWLYSYGIGPFDQSMALTWRYTHGSNFDDCLDFSTVYNNETKSDINANRGVDSWSVMPLQYSNTIGGESADVWYSFTLDQNSTVTITTDHSETDFDSVIRLFDLNQTEIGYDDDSGTGTTAHLSTQLCAGTYKFCVEGYLDWSGLFRVSVAANTLPFVAITNTSMENTTCANSTDGSASWSTENALFSTDFWVNGVLQEESSITGLAVGNYYVEVYDGCDTWDDWSFTIANGDITPPVALCQSSITVTVSEGNPAEITGEDINNGSYDNCDSAYGEISPSQFDTNDEGSNTVALTVTDMAGLTDVCICTVIVEVIVGVEEINQFGPITIQPNPNNGNFQLDLSDSNFSSDAQLRITDCTGRSVYQNRVTNSNNVVELTDAAPGVYLLILTDSGRTYSTRFVIQ